MTALPPLAILGAGNMGGAILRGVVASGVAGAITVTTRTTDAELVELAGTRALAVADAPDANITAVADADIVIVAVKPAMVPAVLHEIAGHLRPGAAVVSLAAGVTIATYESILGAIPILRAMPNTPALVGKAITGLATGGSATPAHTAAVRAVFETVGDVMELPEDRIDALTAISGSGPAYVFFLIETFTEAAQQLGFSATDARLLTERTFIGATALLERSSSSAEQLRAQVTSPGGTTEQGVAVLQHADLEAVFARAAAAALARAQELAAAN